MQTALPAVLALTYPGSHGALQSTPSSLSGVLAAENRWSVLYPLAANFAAGAINMLYLGPKTTSVMRQRKHQGELFSAHFSALDDMLLFTVGEISL